MKKFLAILILLAGSAVQAALLETRLGIGTTFVDPKSYNDFYGSFSSNLKLENYNGIHLDGIVSPPVFPLGLGVRVERQQAEVDANFGSIASAENELTYMRYAVLANWRVIDIAKVFLGPIVTVGTHAGELESNLTLLGTSGSNTFDLDPDGPSATAALEGGIKLGGFIAGLEAGYQFLKFKEPLPNTFTTDLSGPYFRILLGLSFL